VPRDERVLNRKCHWNPESSENRFIVT
jgi:hypothetical protein